MPSANHVQFGLSKGEIISVCNKLGVREHEIGKALKSLVLDHDKSEFFPTLFLENMSNVKIEKIPKSLRMQEETKINVGEMSLSQLKKELGITAKNEKKVMKAKGLYFKTNVENYLMDYIREWNGDMNKIGEVMRTLEIFYYEEAVVQEYTKRKLGLI